MADTHVLWRSHDLLIVSIALGIFLLGILVDGLVRHDSAFFVFFFFFCCNGCVVR
jgi:hypothetical protein